MLKIGDIVKGKLNGAYGTVHYSSFGFSIHMWNEETGTLAKTLGTSEDEILAFWEKSSMPAGYKKHKYGGIVKMNIDEIWLFVKTRRNDRGGNAVSMEIMTIDVLINEYKNYVPSYSVPNIRPIEINHSGGGLLKDLSVAKFEEIFDGHIDEMGRMLWYYPEEHSVTQKYPFFRKAVYEKYGTKAVKHYNSEDRQYEAEAI